MDSIKFKLNESNEIQFKLHVQGTTSEPGAADPEFRFVISSRDISESTNTIGYVFRAKKEENGMVSVVIPSMEGTLIKENKDYIGKMEVLIGSRYFAPSTMNIVFEKEFNITAEAVIDKNNKGFLNSKSDTGPVVTTETVTYVNSVKKEVPNNNIKEASKDKAQQPQPAPKQQPIPQQPKLNKFHITSEDLKNCHGDDKKLKKIIAEKLSKELSPRSKNFVPLVEKTFANVKSKLHNIYLQESKKTTSNNTKTFEVEELMSSLSKDE